MRTAIVFATAIALAAPAAAQAPAVQSGDVTVTARSLDAMERAWRDCIARGCPPPQEIELAMAYGEAQLAEGDYRGSWRTLRASRDRNLKHADAHPAEVARIARAVSRLAGLNGQPQTSRAAAVDTVDSLKAGLDNDDARVLLAQLDVGDAYVPEGRADAALAQYQWVGRSARAKELLPIAAEADFRRAALMTRLSSRPEQGGFAVSARKALDRMIADRSPAYDRYRDAARLLRINLLPARKQAGALRAILPTLSPRPAHDPLLVYAPLIDSDRLVLAAANPASAQQWVNVAYRIRADGSVGDVAVARRSPHLDRALANAAVVALGQRRYAPLVLAPGADGPLRQARYTFVFDVLAEGPIAERGDRASGIAPNENRDERAPADSRGQIRPGTSGEVVTRIPRYRTKPRIDVFDLGTGIVRADRTTS